MDLINSIMDQVSGDNLDRLSSQLGTSPKATQAAAAAAVPTILSSLAGLASSQDGAKKLSSTLNGLDLGKLGSLASMLGGNTNSLTQQGGNLLSSLFGDSIVSNIATAIARYAGLDTGMSKTILSYLTPLILGKVAGAWQSKGGNANALQGLFADQKANIADALPTGFSLASIPGLPSADTTLRAVGKAANAAGSAASDVTRRAAREVQEATSPFVWLLPLAGLLLAALGLWYFFGRGPSAAEVAKKAADATAAAANNAAANASNAASNAVTALKPTVPGLSVPDISVVSKDLSGIFTSANRALAGVSDAASAEAALPQLTELSAKIDGIRGNLDLMPATAQSALGELVGKQFGPLQEQAAKILAMPGLSDQVRMVVEGMTGKLAGLNLAQVSQDATSIFTTLTKTLSGFESAAAADAALPQLQEVSSKIDSLKRVQEQMSPGGQSMLAKLIATARGPLDQLIAKVLASLGVDSAAVKPVLDEIVNKLTGLAAPPG